MADKRVDVLVVGAGPAGNIAALVLRRGGSRVALVDKATLPRDKTAPSTASRLSSGDSLHLASNRDDP